MFFVLAIIGTICSIVQFFLIVGSDLNSSALTNFISMLISTILCWKLWSMGQKLQKNEERLDSYSARIANLEASNKPNNLSKKTDE